MLFFAVTKPKKKIMLVAKIAFLCLLLGVIVPGIYYCLTNAGAMESFMESFKNDTNKINNQENASVLAEQDQTEPTNIQSENSNQAANADADSINFETVNDPAKPESSLKSSIVELKNNLSAKVSGLVSGNKIEQEQMPGEPIRVIKNEPEQGPTDSDGNKASDNAPIANKTSDSKVAETKTEESKPAQPAAEQPEQPQKESEKVGLWQKLMNLIFGEEPQVQLYEDKPSE